MVEVQSLSSCCKIHKRQMKSSDKKGAEDKYFALFTPQNDNKHYTKRTVYSISPHISFNARFDFRKGPPTQKKVSEPTNPATTFRTQIFTKKVGLFKLGR